MPLKSSLISRFLPTVVIPSSISLLVHACAALAQGLSCLMNYAVFYVILALKGEVFLVQSLLLLRKKINRFIVLSLLRHRLDVLHCIWRFSFICLHN